MRPPTKDRHSKLKASPPCAGFASTRAPQRRPAMSIELKGILDHQTDLAIAMGTAIEVWFFNGKVCIIALRH